VAPTAPTTEVATTIPTVRGDSPAAEGKRTLNEMAPVATPTKYTRTFATAAEMAASGTTQSRRPKATRSLSAGTANSVVCMMISSLARSYAYIVLQEEVSGIVREDGFTTVRKYR
jgi:hypothetical protein